MLVARLPAWSVTLLDASGSSATVSGTLKPGHSAAVYLSAIAALVGVLSPLSGGVVTRYSVTFLVKENEPTGPKLTTPISNLGRFVFTLSDLPQTFEAVTLPLGADELVTTGCRAGLDIDLSNPLVASVATGVRDGLFCDPFGADISDICSAYRVGHV